MSATESDRRTKIFVVVFAVSKSVFGLVGLLIAGMVAIINDAYGHDLPTLIGFFLVLGIIPFVVFRSGILDFWRMK